MAATAGLGARFQRVVTERVLAVGAIVMLVAVGTAVARGSADWAKVPTAVWAHLATISLALALTPVVLFRKQGNRRHRQLGWVWATAMFLTAAISFGIQGQGHLGVIHIISAWVVVAVPLLIWRARSHDVVAHRRAVRGLVIGALLTAGFFTFPFDRLLGHWLFAPM